MASPFANQTARYVNTILNQQLPQRMSTSNNFNQNVQSGAGVVQSIDTTRKSAMIALSGGGDPVEYFFQNRWVRPGDAVAAIGGRIL